MHHHDRTIPQRKGVLLHGTDETRGVEYHLRLLRRLHLVRAARVSAAETAASTRRGWGSGRALPVFHSNPGGRFKSNRDE